MHEAKTFPCVAAVCCDVIACYTLFRIFDRAEDGTALGPWLFPWLLLSLLVYGINRLFLRRERSIPAIILLNVALFAAHLGIVLLWCSTLRSVASYSMAVLFVGFTAARAVARCFEAPDAMASIRQLEGCLAVFLMAAWFQALLGINSAVALPALGGIGIGFAAVLSQRLQGAESAVSFQMRGFGSVGLVLVGLAVAMLLFMLFFSAPVGEGALWIWRTVVGMLQYSWRLFCQFLLWLSSFFPDPAPGELEMLPIPAFLAPDQEEGGEGNPAVALILVILMGLLLVAFVLRAIWAVRKLKVGGRRVQSATRQKVSRSRLRLAALLMRVYSALVRWIHLRWRMLLLRNTPVGVCLSIERRGLLLGVGRRRSETHCAYLRRIAALLTEQKEQLLSEQLLQLAAALERTFYANAPLPPLSRGQARKLRNGVRSVLQRRLLPNADTLARVGSKVSTLIRTRQ